MRPTRSTYYLELRPEGDGPPPIVRVRAALKTLLRHHRLRCQSLRPPPPWPMTHAALNPVTFASYRAAFDTG